jgi:FkbH-like protein
MKNYKKIYLYSDFNLDLFIDFLENKFKKKKYKLIKSHYNQVNQFLRSNLSNKYTPKNRILFIWVSINFFLERNDCSSEKIFKKIRELIELILAKSKNFENILFPLLTIDNLNRENNIFDLKKDFSQKNLVTKINLKLIDSFKNCRNIFPIDSDKWLQMCGKKAFSRKLWYHAKIPYSLDALNYAAENIAAALSNLYSINKKLIIVDLDNTLWGGNLGDLGYNNIVLGGHDPLGESFQDFQKELLNFKNKGIILAICSKNSEKNVSNVFKKNKNMILKETDFAAREINWSDKAINISNILKKLNLTSNACVFLDDSQHERERIKSVFKDMTVPNLPNDPMEYVDFLLNQEYLNIPAQTDEDLIRTKLYRDEIKRKTLKIGIKSHEDWLKDLKIFLKIKKIDQNNFQRVLQLLNKTNQMNLSTNRYTEETLKEFSGGKNNNIFACEVTDKFGSAGIIAIVGLVLMNKKILVNDFVMSCRVFGREIEFAIVDFILRIASKKNIRSIVFNYKKTKKNLPALEFLKKLKARKHGRKYILSLKDKDNIKENKYIKII